MTSMRLGRPKSTKTRCSVYICNPNNPTGTLADPRALRRFILSVPPRVLVFVDEAYLEISDTTLRDQTRWRRLSACAPNVSHFPHLLEVLWHGRFPHWLRRGHTRPSSRKISPYHMGAPTYLSAIAAREALPRHAVP